MEALPERCRPDLLVCRRRAEAADGAQVAPDPADVSVMGTITFSRRSKIGADVAEIGWSGSVVGADIDAIHAVIERGLRAEPGCRFIVGDTAGVTYADPTARAEASRLMKMLSARGVERVVAIAPSPVIRLLCSTIALVSGTPLDLVDSQASAERHLVVLRARAPTRRRPPASRARDLR